jgi:hemolysin III
MDAQAPARERSKDGSRHVTDERFNTASHLAAAIFALLGTVVLIVSASVAAKPWHIVSFSIYGTSLVALFLASTLHHGIVGTARVEELLRSLDYHAIFLLIAGSFTPMCLVALRGPLGWSVFGVSWAVAIAGIALKASSSRIPKWVFLTMYGTLGWLGAAVAWPLTSIIDWWGLALLALGGVLYTAGAVVFALERPNPIPGKFGFHEIWHVFVVAGAAAHYFLMLRYVLPLP